MAQGKLLVGLIGAGIQASLTPAMQEEEAREHGLRLHYQLIDLDLTPGASEQLPALITAARIMGFAGLNITYPCKQAVIPLLDELSPQAKAIGAVNTVVHRDGRLIGHNTDSSGWAWGLRWGLPKADLRCVVLVGAGGAGSAIAHALLAMSAGELRIVDTDHSRAQALADSLREACKAHITVEADVAQALADASGVVHATPTGMAKMPGSAIPAACLRPGLWVSDAVYFPIDTQLLKDARARGCETVNGGGMAVGQAVGAFELFTGRKAVAERMEKHFARLLQERA